MRTVYCQLRLYVIGEPICIFLLILKRRSLVMTGAAMYESYVTLLNEQRYYPEAT